MRLLPAVTVVLTGSVVLAQTSSEERFLDEVAKALGGRERIGAARTLTLEGNGIQYNLGQDVRPGASGQTFTVQRYSRRIDLRGGRARTELTRTPNFAYFRGPDAQEVGEDATSATADFFHHPLVLLQAALSGATLADLRTSGDERSVEVRLQNGATLTLAAGRAGLPVRITSRSHHPNLGDVLDSTSFADYQDVDGLQLPARLTTRIDAFTTADIRVTRQLRDAELAAFPPAKAPQPPAAPNVAAEEVAPGVWLLAGQSHHSALVEFRDHLALIDAPQSEARTLAVIAKAKELRPGKPLTRVVTTHHHFDHTAGIRAAIAEGMTLVTHEGNREFFIDIGQRAFTIAPDTLAKSPRPTRVESVGDERTLSDGTMTVTLYHVAGNPHSDTMLMAHLPTQRLLIQVDAFSPASTVHPYAANLLDNIRRRNLQVERVVPLHGSVVPFSVLEAAAGK